MCLHSFPVSALIQDKVWIPTTLSVRNSAPSTFVCTHTTTTFAHLHACVKSKGDAEFLLHIALTWKSFGSHQCTFCPQSRQTQCIWATTRHLGDFWVGLFVAHCLFFETRCPYVVQANLELCSSTSASQGSPLQTCSITAPSPCDFGLVFPV